MGKNAGRIICKGGKARQVIVPHIAMAKDNELLNVQIIILKDTKTGKR
jgi:hypothetical protein